MNKKDLLVKVHAYVASDGTIVSWKCKDLHGKKIRIRRKLRTKFYNIESALIKDFMNSVMLLYPKLKSIRYYPKRAEVEIRNNTVSKDILTLGKVWSRNWEFPKNLNKKQKVLWIRAFSDCEGTVQNSNYDRFIALDSVNRKGLKIILNELDKMSINGNLYFIKSNGSYRIKIFKKENLKRFANLIGFEHPIKQEKLIEALDSYK